MADLVRDHVGAGEVPRRAEALAQLTEELEVQIHAAVGRAVERPDRELLAAGDWTAPVNRTSRGGS